MKTTVYRILTAVWTVVILVLTGYPSLETPKIKEFPVDKIYHFAVFLILGMLALRVLKKKWFSILCMTVVLFAEVQQLYIPGRDFDVLDILAGVIGVLASFTVRGLWRRKIRYELSKT